jgi:hypothetical protein
MRQTLTDEDDIRLTCVSRATSDEVEVVYDVKHLDPLQDRVIAR